MFMPQFWEVISAFGESVRHRWQIFLLSNIEKHYHTYLLVVHEVAVEHPVSLIIKNFDETLPVVRYTCIMSMRKLLHSIATN